MKIKQSFSLRCYILWQAAFETGQNSNKYLFYRSLTALFSFLHAVPDLSLSWYVMYDKHLNISAVLCKTVYALAKKFPLVFEKEKTNYGRTFF